MIEPLPNSCHKPLTATSAVWKMTDSVKSAEITSFFLLFMAENRQSLVLEYQGYLLL